jgi:hypothetical protein
MIYIIDELILFITNPLGSLIAMMLILYAEKAIIKNIKENKGYNHATKLKIKMAASPA